MKKIKSIKQLKAEKRRIEQRQHELENKIGSNWKELKGSLKPVNLAKDMFTSIIKRKTDENCNDGNALKNSFRYGLSLLARKITDKAGEKLGKVFNK